MCPIYIHYCSISPLLPSPYQSPPIPATSITCTHTTHINIHAKHTHHTHINIHAKHTHHTHINIHAKHTHYTHQHTCKAHTPHINMHAKHTHYTSTYKQSTHTTQTCKHANSDRLFLACENFPLNFPPLHPITHTCTHVCVIGLYTYFYSPSPLNREVHPSTSSDTEGTKLHDNAMSTI